MEGIKFLFFCSLAVGKVDRLWVPVDTTKPFLMG